MHEGISETLLLHVEPTVLCLTTSAAALIKHWQDAAH